MFYHIWVIGDIICIVSKKKTQKHSIKKNVSTNESGSDLPPNSWVYFSPCDWNVVLQMDTETEHVSNEKGFIQKWELEKEHIVKIRNNWNFWETLWGRTACKT